MSKEGKENSLIAIATFFDEVMEGDELTKMAADGQISKTEALKIGAECEFPERYPNEVTVYKIEGFSKELCGGPHVKNTKELAKSGDFKIIKEKSVGSGVRRLKAVLS